MFIIRAILIGFEQIRSHKLRATLSILGILISVASVVAIVSLGDGLKATVLKNFDEQGGMSLIWVRGPDSWYRQNGRWVKRDWEDWLENDDIKAFRGASPHIVEASPAIFSAATAEYHGVSDNAQIRATNEFGALIMNWKIVRGRFMSESDIARTAKVLLVNEVLADDMFGDITPLGKEMALDGERFTIIGVTALEGRGGDNWQVIMPYSTYQRRFAGNDRIDLAFIRADDPNNVAELEFIIRGILKRRHEHGDEFRIETGASRLDEFNRIVLILKMVAGGIAGISLVVGGIGIMNIMLVSVTERTREIGIRMAVGASRGAILIQFVLESIVLCLFGGGFGVALGIGFGQILETIIQSLGDNPFRSVVTPQLMAFAVLYSAIVGVFFGVYPAWQAAKMDPVEALRHE